MKISNKIALLSMLMFANGLVMAGEEPTGADAPTSPLSRSGSVEDAGLEAGKKAVDVDATTGTETPVTPDASKSKWSGFDYLPSKDSLPTLSGTANATADFFAGTSTRKGLSLAAFASFGLANQSKVTDATRLGLGFVSKYLSNNKKLNYVGAAAVAALVYSRFVQPKFTAYAKDKNYTQIFTFGCYGNEKAPVTTAPEATSAVTTPVVESRSLWSRFFGSSADTTKTVVTPAPTAAPTAAAAGSAVGADK